MSYQAWTLMRSAIVPKFQTTSASLVSQLVAGLDALMSSAWCVQRTHAINGIRNSTREILSRSRSQTRSGGLGPQESAAAYLQAFDFGRRYGLCPQEEAGQCLGVR